ncbi:MAG: DUF1622 domain-containing protein [Synechococcaceae cyanobacterium]
MAAGDLSPASKSPWALEFQLAADIVVTTTAFNQNLIQLDVIAVIRTSITSSWAAKTNWR